MTSYLLSYDLTTLGDLLPQLQSFIKQHKLISQWSNPYPGLYILKSESDLASIVSTFDEFFARKVLHFICPITVEQAGGILYTNVWEWMSAPPTNSLGNLLEYIQKQKSSIGS